MGTATGRCSGSLSEDPQQMHNAKTAGRSRLIQLVQLVKLQHIDNATSVTQARSACAPALRERAWSGYYISQHMRHLPTGGAMSGSRQRTTFAAYRRAHATIMLSSWCVTLQHLRHERHESKRVTVPIADAWRPPPSADPARQPQSTACMAASPAPAPTARVTLKSGPGPASRRARRMRPAARSAPRVCRSPRSCRPSSPQCGPRAGSWTDGAQ